MLQLLGPRGDAQQLVHLLGLLGAVVLELLFLELLTRLFLELLTRAEHLVGQPGVCRAARVGAAAAALGRVRLEREVHLGAELWAEGHQEFLALAGRQLWPLRGHSGPGGWEDELDRLGEGPGQCIGFSSPWQVGGEDAGNYILCAGQACAGRACGGRAWAGGASGAPIGHGEGSVPRWQLQVWVAIWLVPAPVRTLAFWGAISGPVAAAAPLHVLALALAQGARLEQGLVHLW